MGRLVINRLLPQISFVVGEILSEGFRLSGFVAGSVVSGSRVTAQTKAYMYDTMRVSGRPTVYPARHLLANQSVVLCDPCVCGVCPHKN